MPFAECRWEEAGARGGGAAEELFGRRRRGDSKAVRLLSSSTPAPLFIISSSRWDGVAE